MMGVPTVGIHHQRANLDLDFHVRYPAIVHNLERSGG